MRKIIVSIIILGQILLLGCKPAAEQSTSAPTSVPESQSQAQSQSASTSVPDWVFPSQDDAILHHPSGGHLADIYNEETPDALEGNMLQESPILLGYASVLPGNSKAFDFTVQAFPPDAFYCTAYASEGSVSPRRMTLAQLDIRSTDAPSTLSSYSANTFTYHFGNYVPDALRIELTFYDINGGELAGGALLVAYYEDEDRFYVSTNGEGVCFAR